MTTLAQLHDCHSCNDERSLVQKKPFIRSTAAAVSRGSLVSTADNKEILSDLEHTRR